MLTDSASCDEVMPLIAQERVTHVALVPALAQLWVQARSGKTATFRRCASFRQAAPGSTRRLLSRLSPPLTVPCNRFRYGGRPALFYPAGRSACHHSPQPGRPLSPLDEIRIVDQDENDVAPGETGQLLTRGPYTISGYYRAPAHNAQAFTAQGFYRTGDNVRLDEVGNLHVEGRIKEQINRAGEK